VLSIKSEFKPHPSCLATFVNSYSYTLLIESLNQNELEKFEIYADGILVVMLERYLNRNKVERVSFDFSSIAGEVFEYAIENRLTVSFVGSKQENLDKFLTEIRNIYPELRIGYVTSGFFDAESQRDEAIFHAASSDIVITAMGAPHQEQFLLDLSLTGWRGMGFTCGGFFDQTAEAGTSYYPAIINRLELRWLYRLYKEPRRLSRRYLINYPCFVFNYLRSLI